MRNKRSSSKPAVKKVIIQLLPMLLAVVMFLVVNFASSYPSTVEKIYSRGLYPFVAVVFSWFSNLFVFSLWDFFWTLLVFGLFFYIVLIIRKKQRWGISILRLVQILSFLYCFFYLSWGFNYFRTPLREKNGWEKQEENAVHFLKVFDALISEANESRVVFSATDYHQIDDSVEASYRKYGACLGLNYPNGSRRAKTMLYSGFFAKSGVSGYFGPFFNEVHLNGNLLPTEYPFVLAHEKAHQFGISSEAEANFVAWYICTKSSDKRLRYSATIQIMQYFLADPHHLKEIKEYLKRFDQKAMADIRAQRNHWKEMRNATLDKAQTAANDAYLKTNKIHEGVKNYNSVIGLMIDWHFRKD